MGWKGVERKVFIFQFHFQQGLGRFGCSTDNAFHLVTTASVASGNMLQPGIGGRGKAQTKWSFTQFKCVKTHHLKGGHAQMYWLFVWFIIFANSVKVNLKSLTSTPSMPTITKWFLLAFNFLFNFYKSPQSHPSNSIVLELNVERSLHALILHSA